MRIPLVVTLMAAVSLPVFSPARAENSSTQGAAASSRVQTPAVPAGGPVEGLAYGGAIGYGGDSENSYAALTGAYAYLGLESGASVEAEVDHTVIVHRSLSQSDQWDGTIIYSRYALPGWKLRAGMHSLALDNSAPGATTFIVGADHVVSGRLDTGADAYVTQYAGPRLTVLQGTLHAGATLLPGSHILLQPGLALHAIHLGDGAGVEPRDLLSLEGHIDLHWRRLEISPAGWIGRQAFAVRDSGFTLYNLADLYRGGASVQIGYLLDPSHSVKVRWEKEQFQESGRGAGWSDSIVVFIGVSY